MNDSIQNSINDADAEYEIVVKKADDIISELTDDLKERLIYETIINGIEKHAADSIKDNKIVQLPAIGCVRKNPIRQVIKDNFTNFSIAKKNMTHEQYRDHVREIIIDAKEWQRSIAKEKAVIKNVRKRNKKKYDKLYITLGKAYAEMYIQSLLMFREVPYILEVQEHYDRLNGLL